MPVCRRGRCEHIMRQLTRVKQLKRHRDGTLEQRRRQDMALENDLRNAACQPCQP